VCESKHFLDRQQDVKIINSEERKKLLRFILVAENQIY